MPDFMPVIELINEPVPEPFIVLLSEIKGVDVVFQQTPRVIIAPPPSFDIVPPVFTVVFEIFDKSTVVKTAKVGAGVGLSFVQFIINTPNPANNTINEI